MQRLWEQQVLTKKTKKFLRSKVYLRQAIHNRMLEELFEAFEGLVDAFIDDDIDLGEEFGRENP